ncbi:hypothetical protein QBC45DRAFT_325675 [Copromyces sp. CBS 386.78]|nr:hypothetical protein QBC45DRAFT_325675 [Copromyces sp. CBS 386.78]
MAADSTRPMTHWRATAISILSAFLVCFIGGITIGAIFLTPIMSNVLGDTFSPGAIALINVILSAVLLGSIFGLVFGGIVLWKREAIYLHNHVNIKRCSGTNPRDGYDEDVEANRARGPRSIIHSIPFRARPDEYYDSHNAYYAAAYDSDSDSSSDLESFTYSSSPAYNYRKYSLEEAHSVTRHNMNTSRAHAASNISHGDSDPYTLDLYDDDYEADSESSPPMPPTPGDSAPLLQNIRRGPSYS